MSSLIIIPAGAQPPTTYYDEATVYGQALVPSDVAALYAGGLSGPTTDPQSVLGLEELYGTDQPHDTLTPPLLANGFCRVRWNAATVAFIMDAYLAGVGYIEVGRATIWGDDTSGPAAGIFQYGQVLQTELVRWTPELAVLQVTMGMVVAGQVYRAEVYIRLGRGWVGPRFEVYPARRAGVALGAHVRFSPYFTDPGFAAVTGTIGVDPFFSPSDEGTWAGGTGAPPVGQNWLVYGNQRTATIMAVLRTGVRYRSYTDSVAYGTSRNSLAVAADQATAAVAGYVTVRYGFSSARAPITEAETQRNASSGTTSVVADGAAAGGQALNDTQTAEANTSTFTAAAALARLPVGKYGVWARVRATTGGDTMSIRANFSGTGGSLFSTTSTSYVWLYLGEITRTATTDFFWINMWRSAGVGTTGVRLDRYLLVPTERRQAADPDYDGARDLAQEFLFDSRAVPELVAR